MDGMVSKLKRLLGKKGSEYERKNSRARHKRRRRRDWTNLREILEALSERGRNGGIVSGT